MIFKYLFILLLYQWSGTKTHYDGNGGQCCERWIELSQNVERVAQLANGHGPFEFEFPDHHSGDEQRREDLRHVDRGLRSCAQTSMAIN